MAPLIEKVADPFVIGVKKKRKKERERKKKKKMVRYLKKNIIKVINGNINGKKIIVLSSLSQDSKINSYVKQKSYMGRI